MEAKGAATTRREDGGSQARSKVEGGVAPRPKGISATNKKATKFVVRHAFEVGHWNKTKQAEAKIERIKREYSCTQNSTFATKVQSKNFKHDWTVSAQHPWSHWHASPT
eukprot:scaffold803_cov367-Pavlova_lutheri.AAC.7